MKINKAYIPPLLAAIGILVGNRIFNHVNAWIGIVIITTSSLYLLYKFTKLWKK